MALEVRGQTGIGDPGGSGAKNPGPDLAAGRKGFCPARPRLPDAEGPELHGKNHRTGHGDGPSDQRKLVKLNVARFRAPADTSCESGGSGDVHGQTTDGKAPREWRGVSYGERSALPLTNFGHERTE